MIYIFSDILFGIFYGIFRNPYFSLLSIKSNFQQVGAFLFRQKMLYGVPWIFSLAVLLLICLMSAIFLSRKVKGIEVIK
jgi:hypothetical protein